MNWNTWPEFIGMGGYAPYVWGSLGMMAAVIVIEVWQVGARLRALRRSVIESSEQEVSP